MKVLQLCHKMPVPPSDGGAQVMHYTTLGLLANKVQLKVIAINPTRNYIEIDSLSKEYKEAISFEAVKVDTRIKPFSFLLNLFRKESYLIERFISADFSSKLQEVLKSQSFDIIQLEHLYLCKYIPILRMHSKAKIVLRPQNIEYIIWERYLLNLKHPIKKYLLNIANTRLKKYEQQVKKYLDGILALTKEDAEYFESFEGTCPIQIIPMGYDYEKLKQYDFEKQFTVPPIVYHLGAMDWLPNDEAVSWFLNKVLPILKEKQPTIKISLSGRNMPLANYAYRSTHLEILGEITQPLQFQEDKLILIVPLWSGSGIRAKIIEGLALGKVIISTTIGAQGIAYENGKNIIIADTPEEFASQIVRCVNSPELCMSIAKNARALSYEYYHSDSTSKKMIQFYTQILSLNE